MCGVFHSFFIHSFSNYDLDTGYKVSFETSHVGQFLSEKSSLASLHMFFRCLMNFE